MTDKTDCAASGLLDDYVSYVLREGDLDSVVGTAYLFCMINLGLPAQTEHAWAEILRNGGFVYEVLFRAMRYLMQYGRDQESFQLSQRWKSPLFARPYIEELRETMSPRETLELNGFYTAFDMLQDGVRQIKDARIPDELKKAMQWVHRSGQSMSNALDHRSLTDPIQALRLGRVVFGDELIDALPERGGTVGLLDIMVAHEGTFVHILGRFGGKVDISTMVATEFNLNNALNLVGVYREQVVEKHDSAGQQEALDYISAVLHDRLWCNVARVLGERGYSQMIVVPDAWTRALPHHLSLVCGKEIRVPEDVPVVQREHLADLFPIEISPSVQALAISQWQLRPKTIDKVLMLADPGQDLPGAAWTANWLKPLISQDLQYKEFVGAEATMECLEKESRDANMIVFCGHGEYCAEKPLNSHLKLSNGVLSLSDIYNGKGVTPGAVYVISACELGTGYHGETIRGYAVPGAMLSAGAACVLAALWEMEDISFGYLTERFLYHLSYPGRRPSAALFRAANDVKKWPREEIRSHIQSIIKWMEESGRAEAQPEEHLRLAELLVWVEDESGDYPFRDERYWGGAVVYGSGWSFQSGAHITDYENYDRNTNVIIERRGEKVADMIKRSQLKSASKDIDEWLSWAHGPERIEPCILQADLARSAGAEPRMAVNLYRRLGLLSHAHQNERAEKYALEMIKLISEGGR
ncbi:MAG: CHAT domain-containing protein [Desulfobacterales bacterium]|nr:CHAT domain-containing protein [Desulfobacterales bacterium]